MNLKDVREYIICRVGEMRYFYNRFLRSEKKRLKVMSIDDTLETIKKKRCSMIRFGDGEIALIRGRDLNFQKANEELKLGLIQALSAVDEGVLICIPDVFGDLSCYTEEARIFQIRTLAFARTAWYKYCNKQICYGNAFCSRWSILQDMSCSEQWYRKWFSIWEDEDVVLVEGEYSRTGIGNDMFAKTKSLERIIAPNLQAWDKYSEIYNEVLKVETNKLILLSLGPTAKVLAYHLFKQGYRVLDIGHLDLGYELYRRGLPKGKSVKGKYSLEAHERQDLELEKGEQYERYMSEIRAIIK